MNNKDEIIVEIEKPKNKKFKKKKKINKISNIKKVKKQQNKFRKLFTKTIMIIILIIILLVILASSEIFNVKEISVSGVDKLTKNEIISFSNIKIGNNIFKINFGKTKELIKENPYVESVSIKRVLANKLQIDIKERKVKYIIQLADSYIYIDGQGYVLEISRDKINMPILLGILTDLSNINAGDRLEKEDLVKLNTVNKIVVTAKNYEILDFIEKIDISNSSDYILHLDGKTAYIGDASNLNTRILWVKTINQDNQGVNGKIFINMDLNSKKPYFRVDK